MSNNQYASLQTLPVEILHYIFDCLDIQTIVLSLRSTCRRLRLVVKNYDRYIIDLKLITKSNLRLICHLIDPRKVKSLTLSHSAERYNQIRLFNSLFHVKQFIQVHTLTLIAIKESQLRDILKHVNISSLISLTIDIKESTDQSQSMTALYLRSILIRSKLRKLILNIEPNRIENIDWPNQIEYLEIGGCIHFDQINKINRITRLRTLIIGSCSI